MTESLEKLREDLNCTEVFAHNIDVMASDSFKAMHKRINRIHKKLDNMDRAHKDDLQDLRAQILALRG